MKIVYYAIFSANHTKCNVAIVRVFVSAQFTFNANLLGVLKCQQTDYQDITFNITHIREHLYVAMLLFYTIIIRRMVLYIFESRHQKNAKKHLESLSFYQNYTILIHLFIYPVVQFSSTRLYHKFESKLYLLRFKVFVTEYKAQYTANRMMKRIKFRYQSNCK